MDLNVDKLDDMKYAELQKLAKKLGVKANMKADKLVKCLREYISNEQRDLGVSVTPATDSDSSPGNNTTASSGTTTDSDNEKGVATEKASKPKPKASKKGRKGRLRKKNNIETVQQQACEGDLEISFKIATPAAESKKKPAKRAAPQKRLSNSRLSLSASRSPAVQKRLSQLRRSSVGGRASLGSRPSTPAAAAAAQQKIKTPGSGQGIKRKRSDTYTVQIDDPKVESAKPAKRRSRRDTFEAEADRSPGVQQMMDSMREEMNDTERKENLMATLDKRVKEKGVKEGSDKSTHIPRFTGLNPAPNRTVTPGNKDWEKIHQRHFDKMESIDVYYSKKRTRAESLSTSVKKVKMMTEQMRSALTSLKKHKTPPSIKKRLDSAKVNRNIKHKAALFQSPHRGVPFVPKVTSTSKMNLNFGAQPKTPKIATATRHSPRQAAAKTPAAAASRKSVLFSTSKENNSTKSLSTVKKQPTTTPFKFTASNLNNTMNSTSLNTSVDKPKFDLKASLSKPITWKMHTGKLQPLKFQSIYEEKTNKQGKVPTRDDRRKVAQSRRADSRLESQMKRRGVVA